MLEYLIKGWEFQVDNTNSPNRQVDKKTYRHQTDNK